MQGWLLPSSGVMLGHEGTHHSQPLAGIFEQEGTRLHQSTRGLKEGAAQGSGPLEMRPCLDSTTAKVFYFLELLDERTLF
jgi:hypothetical protein